jgi:hypothetical protein
MDAFSVIEWPITNYIIGFGYHGYNEHDETMNDMCFFPF